MRKFKYFDCGHSWQLLHDQGGLGSRLSCLECGSRKVHRSTKERGWRRAGQAEDGNQAGGFPGRGRGDARRHGGGRRWLGTVDVSEVEHCSRGD